MRRGANTNHRNELGIIRQAAEPLRLNNVGESLRMIAQVRFGETQKCPRRAICRPSPEAGSPRQCLPGFGIPLQLVFAGSQVEPAFRPLRPQRDGLTVQICGFLWLLLQCRRRAPGQVVKIGIRRSLRVSRNRAEKQRHCRPKYHLSLANNSPLYSNEKMRIALLVALFPAVFVGQEASVEQLFNSALQAQQQGDFGLAARNYEQVVKLEPALFGAWANLGVTLVRLGRFDQAIEAYRSALKLDPANKSRRMNLALAFYKKGDARNAVGWIRDAA